MTLSEIEQANIEGTVTPEMVSELISLVRRLGDFAEYMGPRNGWLLPDDFNEMVQSYQAIKGN